MNLHNAKVDLGAYIKCRENYCDGKCDLCDLEVSVDTAITSLNFLLSEANRAAELQGRIDRGELVEIVRCIECKHKSHCEIYEAVLPACEYSKFYCVNGERRDMDVTT